MLLISKLAVGSRVPAISVIFTFTYQERVRFAAEKYEFDEFVEVETRFAEDDERYIS